MTQSKKIPLFSIIIPIYKVEKYLRECVDTVLSQDFDDYELILVDDGSPDNCGKICDDYAQNPKVKVIHQQNGGQSAARNSRMRIARGQYLIFLDSDDYWQGEVLKPLADLIQKGEVDVVLCGYTKLLPHKTVPTPLSRYQEKANFEEDFYLLLAYNDFDTMCCNKVVKRSLVEAHHLSFPVGCLHEDCAWGFDLVLYAESYAMLPTPFYQYRIERVGATTAEVHQKNVQDLLTIFAEKQQVWRELPQSKRKKCLSHYLGSLQMGILYRYFLLDNVDMKALKSVISVHLPSFIYPPSGRYRHIKRLGVALLGWYRFCLLSTRLRKLMGI